VSSELTFVLVGSPNSGKTAFFNAMTGSKKKSANYPGVTVEISSATFGNSDKKITLVDLPGIYSLQAQSFDEVLTRDYVLGIPNKFFSSKKIETSYDQIILIADETQLEKTLFLAMELRKLNLSFQLVLTHHDIAQKRGHKLDIDHWATDWGIEIHTIDNFNPENLQNLQRLWEKKSHASLKRKAPENSQIMLKELSNPQFVAEAFKNIDQTLKKYRRQTMISDVFTERMDHFLLHPWWGMMAMAVVLILVFQILFLVSAPLQDAIESFLHFYHH
jgi:ferrous iron transport protein B